MRIFFLATGLGIGGAEQQVVALADQLAGLGHEVFLCYITGDAKLLPKEQKVKLIALNAKKNPWSLATAIFQLKKIINQIKPDIIHSHMVHANLMARVVKPLLSHKVVLVCTAHNKNEGGKLRMLGYRLTDRLADISTNVSQEAVDAFIAQKATKPTRMRVMYNGIDINKFSFNKAQRQTLRQAWNLTEDNKVLIAIGRLTAAKDYPNLLQAYAKLKNANTLLWIVGEGEDSYKKQLYFLAQQLAIADQVHWLGIRKDIPALLSAADIFVLSSAWEGFGLVVAEAMACERLVVATNSGGVKEVLDDCGWLVPAKQSNSLASAMQEAIALPSNKAAELTKKARQRVLMHYNIEQITQSWLTLYQALLNSKK